MKIYKEIRISMETGEILYEDFFEYNGPISECKGGGGGTTTTNTYDPEQTAAMTEISKEQQQWAREERNMYKYGVDYDPTESISGYYGKDGKFIEGMSPEAEIASNAPAASDTSNIISWGDGGMFGGGGGSFDLSKIPGYTSPVENPTATPEGFKTGSMTRGEMRGYDPNAQTSEMQYQQNLINSAQGLIKSQTELEEQSLQSELKKLGFQDLQIESATRLLPQQTALAEDEIAGKRLSISDSMAAIRERAPVREAFYAESNKPIDIGKRKTEAQAGVEQSFANTDKQATQLLMDRGLDPSAPKYANILSRTGMNKATAIASARTGAQRTAEDEKYKKLTTAMGVN